MPRRRRRACDGNLWIYAATLLYGGQRVLLPAYHQLRTRQRSRARSGWRTQPPWCWSWAGGREINITLSASRRTSGAVTEVLSKERVVSLHSGCGRCVATSHRAPHHIKATLPALIQPQLVVSRRRRISEVNSSPFDIEDPVGRSARYGREDTAVATRESRAPAVCIGALVIPVGEDGVVVTGPRQRTDVGKGRIGSRKLRIAVGRHVDAVKGLVVARCKRTAAECWLPDYPRDCRYRSCPARCCRLSETTRTGRCKVWRFHSPG